MVVSDLSAEQHFEEAKELMINDQFDLALENYNSAIEKCEKNSSNQLYSYFVGRSQAFIKLKRFTEAVKDADSAISINSNDSRAFLKKGIAQFYIDQFEIALATLEEGFQKAEKESERNSFNDWMNKCKQEIKPSQNTSVIQNQEAPTVQQPPSIKHEWYQTESQVTVTLLAKNVQQNDIKIVPQENNLKIESNNTEKYNINLNFNLTHPIIPDQTQIKYLSSKVEIKLKKCEALHWSKLEKSLNDIVVKKTSTIDVIEEKKPDYPTSSRKPKNWDKIAADVAAEEKDEKLEGDAALNKLFKQIYEGGSDEVRKAMNKSFSESGGTVLSTNWTDVGAKKLDVKPPDGMEWRKWD
ncbi:suppressor of G2 allele of SKP1 -like protein [Brachionus plicatilis]|uniref:Suppressor of G2 allele of SKP1-like protein n=1 Tax=Brachionus plicatilis TaxID=10195 RepID=A0A3M7RX56_BRAPC|nr:suppressor of G2 allele of SKP1 -like protein [Brachionus plicatilis]